MSRLTIAKHFHSLTVISRDEVFGVKEALVRPLNLPNDASTMFSGYVGSEYLPGNGILLLAINPGGGGDAYTKRIPEDEVFYPLLSDFKNAANGDIGPAFEHVNASFANIITGWNLWRILGPTLAAAGKTIDEIAYMNVVPYRTREDKMPPVTARRYAWERIVAPTVTLLKPRAIISLGKKAGSVVEPLLRSNYEYYCVPRTIGDSYVSDDAKLVHEKLRTALNGA